MSRRTDFYKETVLFAVWLQEGFKKMKNKLLKRIAVSFLAAVLSAGLIVPVYAEESLEAAPEAAEVGTLSASGYCGPNVKYTWNASTGEVVITGKGRLDTSYNPSEYFSHNNAIKSVVIKDGIQVIGPFTFQSSKNLKKIEIPASCVLIEDHAFNGVSGLNIYYKGTKEQFWNITVERTNQGFLDAKLNFAKGEPHQFKDVTDNNAFYYNSISWAGVTGIGAGIEGGTKFNPKGGCTRAMIVTLLHRIAGKPKSNTAPSFSDVKEGDWYYDAVCWAVEKGITSGYGKGTFSPNAPCTRAMIVTMIHNYDGGYYDTVFWIIKPFFPDVPYGAWYWASVNWAHVESQIANGKGDGLFHPNDPCTRGEAMSFLYRYMNKGLWVSLTDQLAE